MYIYMKISNVILDRNPGSDPMGGLRGCGSKGQIQLSQNMVMFHIKLNEIKSAANTLPADNPLTLGEGSNGPNSTVQSLLSKYTILRTYLRTWL